MKTAQILVAGATLACALAATPALATISIYAVTLNGASESPANASPGVGTATITFDSVLSTMRVQATFSGLLGNVTASHIHCCTANAGTGTAGVATVTPTFTGFPSGVTSGSYDNTFNMLASTGSWNNAFVTAHGGTKASAFVDLLAGAAAGKAYLNIHSNLFPSGELRGFLTPVPEASSYAMMLGGLAVVGALARRRRAA
jgi:hypothetical protein